MMVGKKYLSSEKFVNKVPSEGKFYVIARTIYFADIYLAANFSDKNPCQQPACMSSPILAKDQ